jgi:glycosyltransferase involved in cell wall biosynthesis
MSPSQVSVIIPVFEQLDYLGEAVASVVAQTRRPAEIIVVCDGGRVDPTPMVTGDGVRVHIVSRPRGGPGGARTTGCACASGDLLAFLDVDDVWLPAKLERQVAALEQDAQLDMVFTEVEHFFCSEVDRARRPTFAVSERAGLLPSALVVRASSFARVGGFREGVIFGEFLDWYARAVDLGLVGCTIGETLVRRRVHPRNAGVEFRHARSDYARVVKDLLDRRRRRSSSSSVGWSNSKAPRSISPTRR